MSGRILLSLAWALGFAAGCLAQSNDLVVQPGTVDSGSWLYEAPGLVTNSGSFVVDKSASVTFKAGNSIQLEPGFEAFPGTAKITFHALIDPSVQSVGIINESGGGGTLPPPSQPTKEYIHLNGKVIAVENGQ
ncbi:MAG: 3-coathanger stack domain-containing protein [Terriglobia bacterium]